MYRYAYDITESSTSPEDDVATTNVDDADGDSVCKSPADGATGQDSKTEASHGGNDAAGGSTGSYAYSCHKTS